MKDLQSIIFEKTQQYPLFYNGDNERHWLYFSRIEMINGQKLLVYTDPYCMADIRNRDMTLNDSMREKRFI